MWTHFKFVCGFIFLKETYTFILQECIKLFKTYSKEMYYLFCTKY